MTKNHKFMIIALIVLLMCLISAGCVGDLGGTTPSTQADVTAENEAQLRQLLAQDGELAIRVSGDMEVREGFVVNGTKTLTGDATLTMHLGAELGQSLLMVSENSALTLDGLVLDCNYNSDGIYVGENATFHCLSGTVKHAGAYGILTFGEVTVEDISIEDSEFISICAQTGSRVYVKGGSIQRSASNDVYVVPGAYVNISGDVVMEGAQEHAMINYGTLEIHGGKFGNVNNYLCDNYGELTVVYEGADKEGTIEFYGARNSIFLVRDGSVASFCDVYIHDTQRQGIASLGGDTTIKNCKFENTGSHSIDIQSGKATVETVVITTSKGSGLEASNGSQVTVSDITVNGCGAIGIASRGASITATGVQISNAVRYGITCGDTKTGQGILKVEDAVIKGATGHGIYIYDAGEAELVNIEIADGASRGMYVAATATCKLSGESSIKNMAKGGVEVRGTLQLDDVIIRDNHTQNSGAGVYVADGGEVTMNGGAVYDNSSEQRGGGIVVSDATITIEGTKIYNNTAVLHGGGIYTQKKAVVNLNSGEVTKNYSKSGGNGIYILSAEAKVTVGEDFYLGGNDVKLDNIHAVLYISGNGLNKHSATDPLLLTPNYNAAEGTVVAVCTDEGAAKSVEDLVISGDGSYGVVRSGKKFQILYTAADMDMTGADTVYVTSFKELETAVLSATSKRNIVLKADIVMENRIRLPGGVTIRITDDGTTRTLSRHRDFTDSFFVTHYGTGLYLTGTELGKLVLDGGYSEDTAQIKYQSLIRVSGSTELQNVVLQNNGTLQKEHEVRGALVRQLCGDIKIYNSLLAGGRAYSGGAVMIDRGDCYIEGTAIAKNESTIGGGAIRAAGGCTVEIVSSVISENHAGSTGGGIVALEASCVTVTDTQFESNTAVSYGGAISAQDQGTQIKLIGTDSEAVFKSNSSATAGAVYVVKNVQLEISGYTFDSNAATDGRAGAVTVLDKSSATITGSAFYGNRASASGGAVVADGCDVSVIGCQFGKEDAGNTAGDKAGALLVTGGTLELKDSSVKYNTATGVGGAIYVEKESALNAENTLFEGNKGASGGAIYIVDGASAASAGNTFTKNTAISGTTYGNGGAVYCAGTFTDSGSSFYENEAKNGGAVIVMGTGTAAMGAGEAGAVMKGNTATVRGGAVFVNGGGKTTVTGYTLEANVSAQAGSIQVQSTAAAELHGLTFTGETGRDVWVVGSVTFGDLSGVILVDSGSATSFTISGYQAGNAIEFTPYKYEAKKVLLKAEAMTDADFQAACKAIAVTATAEGQLWYIDDTGTLTITAASVTIGQTTTFFNSLEAAVAYANANGGTGEAAAIVVEVFESISVGEQISITKNIAIVNAAGKAITISRGSEFTGNMFVVAQDSNAMLTFGTNDAAETGKLIIDGASTTAIAARTVTVGSGAAFTLAKNATLQNANSTVAGAAIHTESTNTCVYGTVKDNVTTVDCGGLYVSANAKATIDGATFSGNRGGTTTGALYVGKGAEVVCQNALFENNKGLKGKSTYVNGGAVYCAGTFIDTNSSYIGNEAKNGGAIVIMSGGSVTLTGTDAQKAVFTNNKATGANNSRGGAIFVNSGGCSVTVTGYTFEGNTSTGTAVNTGAGAVHMVSGGSGSLTDVVFQGTAAQKVYAQGSLTISNVTGAHIVANTAVTVSGYQPGNAITFTPYTYSSKTVLTKAEGMFDDDFLAACGGITVTGSADGQSWYIDETGTLQSRSVASITAGGTTHYFLSLAEALTYADTNGGTGDSAAIEIVLLTDVTVGETVSISKNVTIVNAPGKDITIDRAEDFAGNMLVVVKDSDATLTLGTNDAAETGSLIVDAASASNIAGRTVTVESGAGFVLAKNATLQNASCSETGGALQTASKNTYVYGTIRNNYAVKDGAGMEVLAGAEVFIDGAVFSGNSCGSTGSGAALIVKSGAKVTCQNATFENNEVPAAKNGGAIYCAGTFEDTNSTYIGNKAKNGGAIFIPSGGSVKLTGTDAAKAVFKSNTARGASSSKGGAIYVNGGTLVVNGYTFTGNASTTTSHTSEKKNPAVWTASGSATLTEVTFSE